MRSLIVVGLALVTIAAGEPPASKNTPLPGPDPALPTVSPEALQQLTDNRTKTSHDSGEYPALPRRMCLSVSG